MQMHGTILVCLWESKIEDPNGIQNRGGVSQYKQEVYYCFHGWKNEKQLSVRYPYCMIFYSQKNMK